MKNNYKKMRRENLLEQLDALESAGRIVTEQNEINDVLHPVSSDKALNILKEGHEKQNSLFFGKNRKKRD
ncbi:MAG: hypothetical protein IJJ38_01350 [Lachnospiraceae bacterium]|nr:hypothetical protein [Lachnospiraceae bacterium]